MDHVDGLTKADSSLNEMTLLAQQQDMLTKMEERLKVNLVEAITDFANTFKEDTGTQQNKDEEYDTAITLALSTITENSVKQTEQMARLFCSLCKKVDKLEAKCVPTP